MKELFRERDYTRIGYCQSILEAEGIETHVRNRDLVGMMTEVPIPEFFPALCVMKDEDHPRALAVLEERMLADAERVGEQWDCAECGEENPGTFDSCWSCGAPTDDR